MTPLGAIESFEVIGVATDRALRGRSRLA